ncbi:hypothetical protein CR513_54999, partial [Mucuna pruriens]
MFTLKGSCNARNKTKRWINVIFRRRNLRGMIQLQLFMKPSDTESKIIIGDGIGVPMVDIRVVTLCLPSRHILLLIDVVYVPSMRGNLISISTLDKCGYTFEFGSGELVTNFNSIIVGLKVVCWVILNLRDMTSTTNETSSMLWQRCLGYTSRPQIKRLIRECILLDLKISDFDTCVDYIKDKFIVKTKSTGAKMCDDVQLVYPN